MAALATETWTGTDGAAWPAQWTTPPLATGGTATIQTNKGRLVTPGAGTYQPVVRFLNGMATATDIDVTVTIQGSVAGVEQFAYVAARTSNVQFSGNTYWPNTGYTASLEYNATAASSAFVLYPAHNSNTPIQSVTMTLVGTTAYKVRLQCIGTTIRAKVWDASGAEPGTWTLSGTNATTASGKVTIAAGSGGVAAARTFTADDLDVTDGATGPVVVAAGLSGTGTLSATTTPRLTRTGALSGSGTLTATVPPRALPRQVADGVLFATTGGGTKIYKYEVTSDANPGGTVLVYVPEPKLNAGSAKLCFHSHAWTDSADAIETPSRLLPYLHALADAGYVVVSPDYGDSFGNPDAQARLSRAHAWATGVWTSLGNVLLGFSMGGGTSLMATHLQTIPIKATGVISPLAALNAYTDPSWGSFRTALYAAYGASTDVQYLANTAAHDPIRQPAADWTGARIRALTSSADVYGMRNHVLSIFGTAGSTAAQLVDVETTGQHDDVTQYGNAADMVAFYESATMPRVTVGAGLGADGALSVTTVCRLTVNAGLFSDGVLSADTHAQTVRFTFHTPTEDVPFRIEGGLFGLVAHGLSVWRVNGVWRKGFMPTAEVVAASDRFYGGGRIHHLTPDERADLLAGGFGDFIVTTEEST